MEFATAGIQEARSVPAETPDSRVVHEMQRAGHAAWPRQALNAKPDRDQAFPVLIARCASRNECRAHLRTASWRYLPPAAQGFSFLNAPTARAHFPPRCNRRARFRDCELVFQKAK